MNLAAIFFGSFLVALSGAAAPGPLLALNVERTLKRGFRAGPLLVSGHALLEAAVVVLAVKGLAGVLARPDVNNSLGLGGGLLLMLMGAAMLRRRGGLEWKPGAGSARGSDVWFGAAGSVANPYWSIWWATVGMAYMALALPRGIAGIAAFFTGHISADFLWYSAVSFSISRGKNRITGRFYRKALVSCGVFLLGFGAWFSIRGAGGFLGVFG